jgi:hypothetical protein
MSIQGSATELQVTPTPPEVVLRSRTLAQWYCLVLAALLSVRGISTLVLGASFALPGTGWRSVEQLVVASILVSAQRSSVGARRVMLPFAILYIAQWTAGVINGHEAFGVIPVNSRDKVLYVVFLLLAAAAVTIRSRRDAPAG